MLVALNLQRRYVPFVRACSSGPNFDLIHSENLSALKQAHVDCSSYFRFEVLHKSKKSGARVGVIHTPHGRIDTPGFVPVATNGALKYLSFEEATKAGSQLVFSNTYHLMVHPGPDIIQAAGGIHKFLNYNNPMITDSGGFQVFSLGNQVRTAKDGLKGKQKKRYHQDASCLIRLKEDGTIFRSYRNGDKITLTPESSVEAQKKIGADIIIPLDWLLPQEIDDKQLLTALERTHRWETRSLVQHLKDINNQAMYGVIHGGTNPELRKISVDFLSQLPFQGMAIGGSLGHSAADLLQVLSDLYPHMPSHFPVHLLGIGDHATIEKSVVYGIDTFDSCLPSRLGRHGVLLDDTGNIDITQTKYKNQIERPLPYSPGYSFAALHHLIKQHESVGMMLGTLHNIAWMMDKMKRIREKILADEL